MRCWHRMAREIVVHFVDHVSTGVSDAFTWEAGLVPRFAGSVLKTTGFAGSTARAPFPSLPKAPAPTASTLAWSYETRSGWCSHLHPDERGSDTRRRTRSAGNRNRPGQPLYVRVTSSIDQYS